MTRDAQRYYSTTTTTLGLSLSPSLLFSAPLSLFAYMKTAISTLIPIKRFLHVVCDCHILVLIGMNIAHCARNDFLILYMNPSSSPRFSVGYFDCRSLFSSPSKPLIDWANHKFALAAAATSCSCALFIRSIHHSNFRNCSNGFGLIYWSRLHLCAVPVACVSSFCGLRFILSTFHHFFFFVFLGKTQNMDPFGQRRMTKSDLIKFTILARPKTVWISECQLTECIECECCTILVAATLDSSRFRFMNEAKLMQPNQLDQTSGCNAA